MKLSIFSTFALLGLAASMAAPAPRQASAGHAQVKRQNDRPPVEAAVMTDADGNVVPYNRDGLVEAKRKRAAMAKAKARS